MRRLKKLQGREAKVVLKVYADAKGAIVCELNDAEKKLTIPARSVRMVELE